MDNKIVKYRLPCKNCGSSDAACRYADGGVYCHKCETHDNSGKTGSSGYAEENALNEFTNAGQEDFQFYYDAEYKAISERRISEDTCKKFGVRVDTNGNHLFPIKNKAGEILAVKIVTPAKGDNPKRFKIVGSASKDLDVALFGMDAFSKTGRSVTVTEGEYDAMAAYQMTGSKYPHFSIWNGVGGGDKPKKEFKRCFDELKAFDEIVLNFDNDKPGQEGVEHIGPMFPGKIKVVELTEGKDACDYLMANKQKKYVDEYWRAKRYTLGGVINGADTWEKYKAEQNVESIPFDKQYVDLNQKTYGIRKGEIVLVTAGTGCVDADTEFMTPTGWKRIADYQEGDLVMQVDKNKKATFVKPQEYVKLPADTLTHIRNSGGLDQVLSDEHRVIYESRGKMLELPFAEVKRRVTENKYGFQGKLPITFDYSGDGIDFTEGELRLQVAVMADGRIVNGGKDNYTHMRFSKERKYQRLINLCDKYGLPYKIMPMEGEYYSVVVWPKTQDKHFSSEYYNCSKEQLAIILDEVMYWDARYSKLNDYASTYECDVEFIQFAAHALGKRASITVDQRTHKYTNGYCGTVHVSEAPYVTLDHKQLKMDEVETTDGFKYCFVVDTGMLVLRCNGKVFITGNSGKTQVLREWKYHLLTQTKETIFDIALEENLGSSVGGLMALHANRRITLPDVHISEEEERKIHKELFEDGRYFTLDHEGSVEDDNLLDKMEYAATVLGAEVLFLDHITIAVSDVQAGSENLSMDKFMNRLLKMVKRLNICVVVVSHLRKTGGGGKSFEEGRIPTEDDLKGSGSLKQIAMTTIAIARNKYAESERERNTTSFHVLKCRFSGRTGPCDHAYFDDETGRMNVIDPSEFDEDGNAFNDEVLGDI